MDRRTLLREIGRKLQDIRLPLKYSHRQMADRVGTCRTSYLRYESGETAPPLTTLYALAKDYNISMDWLICGIGAMQRQEKEPTAAAEAAAPQAETGRDDLSALRTDVRELIEHMEKIPLLRYQVLTHFHQFKEDHKDLVAAASENE